MQSKEQLQAELMELEAKAANIRKQIESLKEKPTPEQRFIELMLQTNSLKIDKKKYPHSLFGFKDSMLLWEYQAKNKVLLLSYSLIWQILETEYSLHYSQTQLLVKSVVEQHFKSKDLTAMVLFSGSQTLLEQHFKL